MFVVNDAWNSIGIFWKIDGEILEFSTILSHLNASNLDFNISGLLSYLKWTTHSGGLTPYKNIFSSSMRRCYEFDISSNAPVFSSFYFANIRLGTYMTISETNSIFCNALLLILKIPVQLKKDFLYLAIRRNDSLVSAYMSKFYDAMCSYSTHGDNWDTNDTPWFVAATTLNLQTHAYLSDRKSYPSGYSNAIFQTQFCITFSPSLYSLIERSRRYTVMDFVLMVVVLMKHSLVSVMAI